MHAFKRSSRVMRSEDDVPSWLTDPQEEEKQSSKQNDTFAENTPLIPKSNSYGGSSVDDEIVVDYGDNTPSHPRHVSYGINQESGVDTSWANNYSNEPTKSDGLFAAEKDNSSKGNDDNFDDDKIDELESNINNEEREEKKKTSWVEEKSKKDTDDEFQSKQNSAKSLPSAKKPKRYPTHMFFILVQFSGIFGNIAMISTQAIPLIICEDLPPLQDALRVYLIFFSFCFLLGELEVSIFLRSYTSISNWISRGFLYSFIGTIAMEQHKAMIVDDAFRETNSRVKNTFFKHYWSPDLALLSIQISSWWITGIGILYFFMGVACMQNRRDRLRENYEDRWEVYKEQILYGGVEGDLDSADKKLGALRKRKAKK